MREIKFRAWDKLNKKFVCCYQQGISLTPDTGQIYFNGSHNLTAHYELLQYTGLKDKNGKEIYEGDVVNDSYMKIGYVRYSNGYWEVGFPDHQYNCDGDVFACLPELDVEVIGNIYENSELLEVK